MRAVPRIAARLLVALAFCNVSLVAQSRVPNGKTIALVPPTGVTFSATASGLAISWQLVADATQYQVLQGADAVTPGKPVSALLTATSFVAPPGTQDVAAFYSVVALAADGRSASSIAVGYTPPPSRGGNTGPLGAAPAAVPLTPPTFQPNYDQPTISWYGEAGVTYELRRTLFPGQSTYPPILVHRITQQASGTVAIIDGPAYVPATPVDLHQVNHYQLTSDNNQGQVRTSSWAAYQPTPHGGVTSVQGGYWEVPQSSGYRKVYACVLIQPVAGATDHHVTVTRNTVNAGFSRKRSPLSATDLMMVGYLAQGELAGQIIARVEPQFPGWGNVDTQHGMQVVLPAVQQPMTECPNYYGV